MHHIIAIGQVAGAPFRVSPNPYLVSPLDKKKATGLEDHAACHLQAGLP
jgi:hypothetical protein